MRIASRALGLLALAFNHLCLFAQTDRVRLTLKGAWPGHPVGTVQGRVMVVSNRAYVPIAHAGLAIIDVSSPTNLVPVGGSFNRGTAYIAGNYAFVTTEATWTGWGYAGGDLEILDVRDATHPVNVGDIATHGLANRVQVAGDLAYVAEGTRWSGSNRVGALEVFCVSNPASPTFVSRYETSGSINDVEVAGRYAYLAGGDADLQVIDVANPASPVWVGGYSTNVSDPDLGEGGGPSLNVKVVGS
jgi:hypothetical protein